MTQGKASNVLKLDQGEKPWVMKPTTVLNMSTGPVEVSRHVLSAQLADLLTPHTEKFWAAHDETLALLGRVLRTQSRVLMMHGSIRTGIDLALANFIRPGTKVLCIVNGFWGELIAQWSERYGAEVTRLNHELLEPVDVQRVSEAVRASKFDLVTLVHVETNSGIVNPVEEVGKLLSATDTLYFVDTACSVGAMRVETDAWDIDIQTTGSHKCLSAVPGLAVVSVSEKAWAKLATIEPVGTYFEFRSWWRNTVERASVPPFTQPSTLVLALRAALQEIDVFGIEAWWELHERVADGFISEIRDIGFRLLLDDGPAANNRRLYSDTVIAVRYPEHIDDEKFRRVLLDDFGIFVIGNVGEFAGKSFRAGLMSAAQMQPVNVYGALAAFRETAASARCWK
ncbi:pyridoxal-phosphate-dependent aminotransferase family protein [Agrobacterium vitis]|uniref:pyridoxal-phosphate-dependent aminotransferase family protein n=1 Tax=Agrobacterium vitis TaxID=373 RepID=UPI0015747AC6|nr:alanine--glyoxylate aminotransferase family protein [Agrobacterium vitis]NSY14891.1 alanine--glyoxylate aminotransferase family protein [Agrobacterium vitis]NSY24648.1 alanine--glyoxylate aminotransferase family protein [Agrobacterium vitis]WEO75275.1 alanine--glyoxylate aminotransferase family protein [Agrobacterium vitis]